MDKTKRAAFIERNTKETRISLSLDLDGSGAGEVDTGIGFFNHMLELFKKHALVDLTVKCAGDLDVDYHHTALCETSLDLGGRPFLVMTCPMKHLMVRDFEVKLLEEFFRAVSVEGRLNIHLRQIYGDEAHHVCEGFFKSFARALRQAVSADPREKGVPSSKGVL